MIPGFTKHRAAGPTAVTWNPSDKGPDIVLSSGNLAAAPSGSYTTHEAVRATLSRSTGKWCIEFECTATGASNYTVVGLANSSMALGPSSMAFPGSDANGWGYYELDGSKYHNGTSAAYGASYGIGDVITAYWDADAGLLWYAKNGAVQAGGDPAAGTGAAFSGVTGTLFPALNIFASNGGSFSLRPGSSTIAYPIAGFGAWDGS
ncbi:hypothetical protein ISP17_11460 [Dyella ginsengisoli]|uniref:B30.2/SPRY domain-containing protein n=1 Tax=Dyella ginsengisoli TaxID=363848 RepID=A0ABW8JVV5_9GAMM